jgi:hypothetical protein
MPPCFWASAAVAIVIPNSNPLIAALARRAFILRFPSFWGAAG